MRRLFLLLFVLPLASRSQVYLQGGVNTTDLLVSPATTNYHYSGAQAWQIGFLSQFPMEKKGFLYAGLFYTVKQFHSSYFACCSFNVEADFRPQYISIPLGFGAAFPVNNKLSIQVKGGPYAGYAVGGKVSGNSSIGDIIIPKPVPFSRNIDYTNGTNNGDNLRRWDWGLQLGSSLHWNRWLFSVDYQLGLNNLSADNYFANGGYLTYKYRTLQCNLGYRLTTRKK